MKEKDLLEKIKKQIEWIMSTAGDDAIVARCNIILSMIEKGA